MHNCTCVDPATLHTVVPPRLSSWWPTTIHTSIRTNQETCRHGQQCCVSNQPAPQSPTNTTTHAFWVVAQQSKADLVTAQAAECLEWQAVTAGEAQPQTFQGTPLQCCLSSLHSMQASHTSHTNDGCCTPSHVRRSKIMQRRDRP